MAKNRLKATVSSPVITVQMTLQEWDDIQFTFWNATECQDASDMWENPETARKIWERVNDAVCRAGLPGN